MKPADDRRIEGDPRCFEQAFSMAADWHRDQVRAGSAVPYMAHLMGVCGLVLEDGGDIAQASAALVHDSVEDGGESRLAEIEDTLGTRVAEIVDGVTESYGYPKPPWPERKLAFLEKIRAETDEATLRVSAADKVQNIRVLLWDLRREGMPFWDVFEAPPELIIGHYEALSAVYTDRLRQSFLPASLDRILGQLRRQTGVIGAGPNKWEAMFELEREAERS